LRWRVVQNASDDAGFKQYTPANLHFRRTEAIGKFIVAGECDTESLGTAAEKFSAVSEGEEYAIAVNQHFFGSHVAAPLVGFAEQ